MSEVLAALFLLVVLLAGCGQHESIEQSSSAPNTAEHRAESEAPTSEDDSEPKTIQENHLDLKSGQWRVVGANGVTVAELLFGDTKSDDDPLNDFLQDKVTLFFGYDPSYDSDVVVLDVGCEEYGSLVDWSSQDSFTLRESDFDSKRRLLGGCATDVLTGLPEFVKAGETINVSYADYPFESLTNEPQQWVRLTLGSEVQVKLTQDPPGLHLVRGNWQLFLVR